MRILKNRPRPEDPRIHPQGAYPDRRGPMQPRTRSSAAGRVPRLSLIFGPFITVWATRSAKRRFTCPDGVMCTPHDLFDHVY